MQVEHANSKEKRGSFPALSSQLWKILLTYMD